MYTACICMYNYIYILLFYWYTICRGHARNQPKGGCNFPQCSTMTPDHLSQFKLSQRVQQPVQRTLLSVFCIELRSNHIVRLIWIHEITIILSKIQSVQMKGWSRDHHDLQLEWPLWVHIIRFLNIQQFWESLCQLILNNDHKCLPNLQSMKEQRRRGLHILVFRLCWNFSPQPGYLGLVGIWQPCWAYIII